MCGIIAVLRRPSTRVPVEIADVLARLDQVSAAVDSALGGGGGAPAA